MKRYHLMMAAVLCTIGAAHSPRVAAACSRCSTSGPKCEAANYSMCSVRRPSALIAYCSETSSSCAWTYDAGEVSADGSLALAGTAPDISPTTRDGGLTRRCDGLIVARSYRQDEAVRLQKASASIRI